MLIRMYQQVRGEVSEPKPAASLLSEGVVVPFCGGRDTVCEVEEVKVLASLPEPSLRSRTVVVINC
jgi:hypothetical protein